MPKRLTELNPSAAVKRYFLDFVLIFCPSIFHQSLYTFQGKHHLHMALKHFAKLHLSLFNYHFFSICQILYSTVLNGEVQSYLSRGVMNPWPVLKNQSELSAATTVTIHFIIDFSRVYHLDLSINHSVNKVSENSEKRFPDMLTSSHVSFCPSISPKHLNIQLTMM